MLNLFAAIINIIISLINIILVVVIIKVFWYLAANRVDCCRIV